MGYWIIYVALMGASFLGVAATPTNKDTIDWGVGHQPPRVILDADLSVHGQGGIQQNILEQELADHYQANHVVMNWARMQDEMRNGRHVCASFIMKNADRIEYIEYSLPWHIDLPHRVVMQKHTWDSLGSPDILSLNALAQHQALTGVVGIGRSYGHLDPVLYQLGEHSNLLRVSTGPINGLTMLARGRMDYGIEHPYFVEYFAEQHELPVDSLKMIPIEEAGSHNYTYVGCPKNAWGKQVISRVNEVIKRVRTRDSYLKLLQDIYSREQDKQAIESIYRNDFMSAGD